MPKPPAANDTPPPARYSPRAGAASSDTAGRREPLQHQQRQPPSNPPRSKNWLPCSSARRSDSSCSRTLDTSKPAHLTCRSRCVPTEVPTRSRCCERTASHAAMDGAGVIGSTRSSSSWTNSAAPVARSITSRLLRATTRGTRRREAVHGATDSRRVRHGALSTCRPRHRSVLASGGPFVMLVICDNASEEGLRAQLTELALQQYARLGY